VVKHGGSVVLGEGSDIVTGETSIPASLNVNNLGEAAVLHLPLMARAVNLNPQINIFRKKQLS
jgi:hypothetical protein